MRLARFAALTAIAIFLGFAVGFHAACSRNALFELIVAIKRAAPRGVPAPRVKILAKHVS